MAQYFFRDIVEGGYKKPPYGLELLYDLDMSSFDHFIEPMTGGGWVQWSRQKPGSGLSETTFNFGFALTPAGKPEAEDVEVLFLTNCIHYSGTVWPNGGPTLIARQKTSEDSRYELGIGSECAITTYFARSRLNGVPADIANNNTGISRAENRLWVKLAVSGDKIRFKRWFFGDAEPVSWAQENTNTVVTGAGRFGLVIPAFQGMNWGSSNGGTRSAIFQLSFGTGGDPAPMSPLESTVVSGTVRDEDGNLASRTIRVKHRATGVLLAETESDPVTGEYSVEVFTEDELLVTAINGATEGTIFNDLNARVLK
jgi:hypothetical protein